MKHISRWPHWTKNDHTAALKRIEALWEAKPGTPEGDELDSLADQVDAYEREAFPITNDDGENVEELLRFVTTDCKMDKKHTENLITRLNPDKIAKALGAERAPMPEKYRSLILAPSERYVIWRGSVRDTITDLVDALPQNKLRELVFELANMFGGSDICVHDFMDMSSQGGPTNICSKCGTIK